MNLKSTDNFTDLIAPYVEEVRLQKPGVAANVKSLLHKFGRLIGRPLSIAELVLNHDDLLDGIDEVESENPNSMRAMRSRVSAAADWAYHKGIVSIPPETAERVGLLPRAKFADWHELPRALTVYRLFVNDLAYAKLDADNTDDGFVMAFMESLDGRIANWRQCWLAFARRWECRAEEGLLPEIDFPCLPSKRRSSYAAKEEDLPHRLRIVVEEMRSLFNGSDIEKRKGEKPLRSTTAELNIGSFLRLCGFIRHEKQQDIANIAVRDILSLENAKALIDFTNKRALDAYGITIGSKVPMQYGEYELSTLRQLSSIVRECLQDEALQKDYLEEIHHIADLVCKRREALKQPGHPDDYFKVALELWERAEHAPPVTAATIRRDALIIALIALFAYRIGVVSHFKIGEHIRLSDDKKSGLICIPRTETKPCKRDIMHEIPPEMMPMVLRVIEE